MKITILQLRKNSIAHEGFILINNSISTIHIKSNSLDTVEFEVPRPSSYAAGRRNVFDESKHSLHHVTEIDDLYLCTYPSTLASTAQRCVDFQLSRTVITMGDTKTLEMKR